MRGAATQAMPVCIVEERQQSRCPPAAPLRAAARRPAGGVARSLHTAPGMLVARALPAGLGASSKMYTLFPDGPLVHLENGQEGFLRDFDLAQSLHALFPFFLLFEQFPFACDVSAVILCYAVLAQGPHDLAGNDLASHGGLDG